MPRRQVSPQINRNTQRTNLRNPSPIRPKTPLGAAFLADGFLAGGFLAGGFRFGADVLKSANRDRNPVFFPAVFRLGDAPLLGLRADFVRAVFCPEYRLSATSGGLPLRDSVMPETLLGSVLVRTIQWRNPIVEGPNTGISPSCDVYFFIKTAVLRKK